MLTYEEAQKSLSYNPDTGSLIWKSAYHVSRVGSEAGSVDKNGYVRVTILGGRYLAHRLAYLLMLGHWPSNRVEIDHKNRNPSDNRWSNIRLATRSQNSANRDIFSSNKSGVKGVYFNKERSKWHATIKHNGKRLHIGYFDSKECAAKVRIEVETNMLGQFSPHFGC